MRPLIAMLSMLLLSGCAMRVTEQEIYARFDGDDDSLQVLLVYKQLHHNPEQNNSLDDCVDFVEQVIAGRRKFWFKGFLGAFDLDNEETRDELTEGQRAFLDGITMDDRGVFLDSEQRLCGYQVIRVPAVTEGVRELNAALSLSVLESIEEGKLREDDSPLDDRSYALIEERARSGEPWFRLVESGFEIDLPITRASWDAVQKELILEAVAVPDERAGHEIAQLLGHVRHLDIGAERVTIRLGAPDGLFRFVFRDKEPAYTDDLKRALEEKGVSFEGLPGIEEVRGKIR